MVNVAGLIAREIEGIAGDEYDLPLQAPKVKVLKPASAWTSLMVDVTTNLLTVYM